MKKPAKDRIDKLLVEKGFAPTKAKAQAMILAGTVLADEMLITKPGRMVHTHAVIRIKGDALPYVSRGGLKLEQALREFGVDVKGLVCMDVGASTGGFSDCLLKNLASKIYAIDVGWGQMSPKIAGNPKVEVLDRRNIRYLAPLKEKVDFAAVDVSFISLCLVLHAVDRHLKVGSKIIALIKPQFEVGRALVGKGGIVKSGQAHELAVDKVLKCAEKIGWESHGVIASKTLGAKGNKEFLAFFSKK